MKMFCSAVGCLLLAWAFPCRGGEPANAATSEAPKEHYQGAFDSLSTEDAKKKGQEMAAADFARGKYCILVYGMPSMPGPYEKHLKERYAVEQIAIAGCIVNDGILGGANGYNGTMQPLLNKKFGHDIFKEATALAAGRSRDHR